MEENNTSSNMEQKVNQVANAPTNQTQEETVSQSETITTEAEIVNNAGVENSKTNTINKKINICCLLSFIFSMIGIIVYGFFCGIAATILGIIGLATFKPERQTARWQGITGLTVGAVEFVFMGLIILISVTSIY